MKTLLLMRHAKSDWSGGEDDFDRPLNARGQGDLPRLAHLLTTCSPPPQLILSSSALRARQTAAGVETCLAPSGQLRFDDRLYLAPWQRLIDVLAETASGEDSAMLVAHNPGMAELVGALGGGQTHMPTGGVALFDLHIDRWNEIKKGSGQLRWLVVPRLLKALAA